MLCRLTWTDNVNWIAFVQEDKVYSVTTLWNDVMGARIDRFYFDTLATSIKNIDFHEGRVLKSYYILMFLRLLWYHGL
jgi:hypothetical protein